MIDILVVKSPLGSVSDDILKDNKTNLLRIELVSYGYRTREIGDYLHEQYKQIEAKIDE